MLRTGLSVRVLFSRLSLSGHQSHRDLRRRKTNHELITNRPKLKLKIIFARGSDECFFCFSGVEMEEAERCCLQVYDDAVEKTNTGESSGY